MAYASRLGRAFADPSNPKASAMCDRCGFVYQHAALTWQFDYRGPVTQNLRILVCDKCRDNPQMQLKAIAVPADPMPRQQPRVQNYEDAETDFRVVSEPPVTDPTTGIPIPSTTVLTDMSGNPQTLQPLGSPDALDINAIMPLAGAMHYGVEIEPLSITADGNYRVTVTFAAPHTMATDNQIVVQGLSDARACGAYSIVVTTATAFTYQTSALIPVGALLTEDTLMLTANIGLPRGYAQIPQSGV